MPSQRSVRRAPFQSVPTEASAVIFEIPSKSRTVLLAAPRTMYPKISVPFAPVVIETSADECPASAMKQKS